MSGWRGGVGVVVGGNKERERKMNRWRAEKEEWFKGGGGGKPNGQKEEKLKREEGGKEIKERWRGELMAKVWGLDV